MKLALSMLAAAACLAVPVLADKQTTTRSTKSITVISGPNSRVAGQRMEMAMQSGGMQGGRGSTGSGTPLRMIGPYGAQDLPLSDSWYRENRYRLTPREYHRLRAQGFSRDEVFMIANAARTTGLDTRYFADAIYRGLYGRQFVNEWGIAPSELTKVDPEWRTQAWADAVRESRYDKERLSVGL